MHISCQALDAYSGPETNAAQVGSTLRRANLQNVNLDQSGIRQPSDMRGIFSFGQGVSLPFPGPGLGAVGRPVCASCTAPIAVFGAASLTASSFSTRWSRKYTASATSSGQFLPNPFF